MQTKTFDTMKSMIIQTLKQNNILYKQYWGCRINNHFTHLSDAITFCFNIQYTPQYEQSLMTLYIPKIQTLSLQIILYRSYIQFCNDNTADGMKIEYELFDDEDLFSMINAFCIGELSTTLNNIALSHKLIMQQNLQRIKAYRDRKFR